MPPEHNAFLKQLSSYYETDEHFFVHASYYPNRRMADQDSQTLFWEPLDDELGQHYSGKNAILGHSPQMDGRILDVGHFQCIDTGCGFGGILTAFDVLSGQIWQVDEQGRGV